MKERFYFGKPGSNQETPFELDFGDDAVPYTGRCLISVADGTGARAGFPQRNINSALLQKDTSFETATHGCLGKEPWHYREQYEENFGYLLHTGKNYNLIGARKSGYFGSRLTTIFMRRVIEDKLFRSEEELAAQMHALHSATEEERDAMLTCIEHRLMIKLDKKLKQAVKNCNLDWNYSSDNNLSLMGTTYSGVIFFEEADEVHMISIQAGDSLTAVLIPYENEKGHIMLAMRRLLPAQENAKDGSLTNCVGTNHEFYFRCGYHCVKKPCAILTCSDGCFDAFPSMRWFEHFVMTHLSNRENGDLRDAMKNMHSYFATPANDPSESVSIYVSTDDSSTMAIAAFGFEHYMRLCQMAGRRIEDLNTRYCMADGLAKQALSLAEESQIETNRVERNREKVPRLRPYAERCWNASEWLRQRCLARMEEPTNQARIEAEVKNELNLNNAATAECTKLEQELKVQVERNWLSLRERPVKPDGLHRMFLHEEDPADTLGRLYNKHRDMEVQAHETRRQIIQYAVELAECADSYTLPVSNADKISACHAENMKQINLCVSQLQDAGERLGKYEKAKESLHREYDDVSKKLLVQEAPAISSFIEKLLQNDMPPTFYRLASTMQQNFANMIQKIQSLRTQIQLHRDTVYHTVRDRLAYKLFINRPVALIEETILQHPDSLPQDLRAELQSIMDELDEKYPIGTEKSRREQENDENHTAELESIMVRKE